MRALAERGYPEYLHKNEGPFSRGQLARLASARVAVAGLGAFGLGAVGLAQLGVGSGPGGFLRIADPDSFETHNANRQALAGPHLGRNKAQTLSEHLRSLIPDLVLDVLTEGVTLDNVDAFLEDAELVVDAVDFLRPGVKLELHRRARARGIPVVAGLLVERGAVGYFFDPASSPDFDEFFAFPEDPQLRSTWALPLSRIVVTPQTPAQQRMYFDILNARHPIPSNSMAASAVHLLLNHLAVSHLLGQELPRIPRMAYLEPTAWSMGSLDLGPALYEQAQSPWTRLAQVYDDFMAPADASRTAYLELVARVGRDLAGCGRVLEAGCGTGILCEALARGGAEAFGIDLNLAMLARARHRARHSQGRMLVGEGDVERLFFEDQSFDGYVSVNVVLLTDLEKTMAEAYRVLRPGGTLVVTSFETLPDLPVLDGEDALTREFAACARCLHRGLRLHTAARVEGLLRYLGFSRTCAMEQAMEGTSFYLVARK